MKPLEKIRRKLCSGDFEFTRHAFRRAIERNISEREIEEAGTQAEIIENYPDDKYFPSVLLMGFTEAGRPLHIQASIGQPGPLKIITLYEPDEMEWVSFSKRR
ncbi:MAG: DUF4258 domain-containing protein [Nitrospinae bacterium]|nr:DUF4258 domain-containing protein [Nitrospinota bacterium]